MNKRPTLLADAIFVSSLARFLTSDSYQKITALEILQNIRRRLQRSDWDVQRSVWRDVAIVLQNQTTTTRHGYLQIIRELVQPRRRAQLELKVIHQQGRSVIVKYESFWRRNLSCAQLHMTS